jgi:anti-sigma regulatory factor (Ser/Thr protein kinase)
MEPLTVPGVLDSLKTIRDYVRSAAAKAGFDKKVAYTLSLAVDEVATNIILYGYEEAGLSGNVTVESHLAPDSLKIVLEDTGIAYDPTQYDLPTEDDLNRLLDERPIGGLGIMLAMEGVDDFHYERVGDRNRNSFIVRLHSP